MTGGWAVHSGGNSGGWQVHDVEWGKIIGDILDQTDLITYLGGAYLKLNQTVPQHVVSGSPEFDEGLTIKENKWLYLDGL